MWLNKPFVHRGETNEYVKGYSGAKFKKFKSPPEAEMWYRQNLPTSPMNTQGINPDVSPSLSPDRTTKDLTNKAQDFILSDRELMRELEEDG